MRCSMYVKIRSANRVLVRTTEGKRPLRPKGRWEDNIKIDLQEIGWGSVGLICLA
jgi:hypothetical protein